MIAETVEQRRIVRVSIQIRRIAQHQRELERRQHLIHVARAALLHHLVLDVHEMPEANGILVLHIEQHIQQVCRIVQLLGFDGEVEEHAHTLGIARRNALPQGGHITRDIVLCEVFLKDRRLERRVRTLFGYRHHLGLRGGLE